MKKKTTKRKTTAKKKTTTRKAAKSTKARVTSKKSKAPASKPSEKALVKYDPLQRYLTEISNYNLLTREQERELGAGHLQFKVSCKNCSGVPTGVDAEFARPYPGRKYRPDAGG
jgi:hypothetical protein